MGHHFDSMSGEGDKLDNPTVSGSNPKVGMTKGTMKRHRR